MIDSAAYRANETNAKRAIADWRLSNINDPYVFQNQGFPVRADSFLDLAQILDTMQEERFDYYMAELGGFTEQDKGFFVKVCLDYIDFYRAVFQREKVVVPLSTLISHFVVYKKLLGYNPGFTRLLELGPGCGYLSFFLKDQDSLVDYTQIESTESFYLLQSHINSHVFGSRFTEHALSRQALDDHSAYIPKGNWHNPFHYEHQKIINVRSRPICNHYPWWRIGDVANRQYDIVTSNANLNEFSREALFQYLSLIGEVLADDGALVAQCLGGGPVTYDTIFTNMKSAGFVPVALVQGDNVPSRTFVVSNGVFVGEKHPLYSKYASARPQFPLLDRNLDFVNSMFFINEDQLERKHVQSIPDILSEILDQIEAPQLHSGDAAPRRGLNVDAPNLKMELRDVNRLRRVAQLERIESGVAEAPKSFDRDKVDRSREALRTEAERIRISTEIVKLKEELEAMRSSRSWRITKPLRSVARLVRRRLPSVVRLAKWLRA